MPPTSPSPQLSPRKLDRLTYNRADARNRTNSSCWTSRTDSPRLSPVQGLHIAESLRPSLNSFVLQERIEHTGEQSCMLGQIGSLRFHCFAPSLLHKLSYSGNLFLAKSLPALVFKTLTDDAKTLPATSPLEIRL